MPAANPAPLPLPVPEIEDLASDPWLTEDPVPPPWLASDLAPDDPESIDAWLDRELARAAPWLDADPWLEGDPAARPAAHGRQTTR